MTKTTLCAWCLRDAGQVPDERDSHGVCKRHAAQLMREAEASRAARKAAAKKQVVHHV
jgi:hypothetical protein